MKKQSKIKGEAYSEGGKEEVQKMHTRESIPHACLKGAPIPC